MTHDTLPSYPGKELEAMSRAVNYHQWIVDEFEPYLGESIAEVGAGMGSVSKMLLAKGLKRLYAFEPSQNMYPYLERELKDEERALAINDFFGPRYADIGLDAVVYINVLEHIEDDRAELMNALTALRPNGHALLFVPAQAWLYSKLDKQLGHYRRYTAKGLSALVQEVGLSIVKVRYFDFVGMIPWYINYVLLQNTLGKNSVSLYDRLAVPTMRRVERLVRPPIGKNVLLIGKKG